MNIATTMQKAVDYIEEHLTDDIDYNELAKKACMSVFYFQRIFKVLFGYTVGEYIRFRRLTLAGSELMNRNVKVIDIAMKYGYETPESFSRAFKEFHGILPSKVDSCSKLKIFSRFSVIITLRGGSMDNYRIVKKDAFYVLGKIEKQTVDDEINKNTIPAFWERCWQDSTVKTLISHMTGDNNLFGICYNSDYSDSKSFDYMIGCMCDKDCEIPNGYTLKQIPARTWIVFDCVGPMPEAMQTAWHKVCAEIIPSSGYEPTYEFDLEVYSAGNMNSPQYESEIWIPIKDMDCR